MHLYKRKLQINVSCEHRRPSPQAPPHPHWDGHYKNKTGKIASVSGEVEKLEPLCFAGESAKWHSMGSSSKIKQNHYNPAIPLLGVYPKEWKEGT